MPIISENRENSEKFPAEFLEARRKSTGSKELWREKLFLASENLPCDAVGDSRPEAFDKIGERLSPDTSGYFTMRRFQFSLRTALIVMAVLTVPLGWWSWKAERQRQAVVTLEARGATVIYKGQHSLARPLPYLVDWWYRVRLVQLTEEPADADIAALKVLDGLEEVLVDEFERDGKRLKAALPGCRVIQDRFGFRHREPAPPPPP